MIKKTFLILGATLLLAGDMARSEVVVDLDKFTNGYRSCVDKANGVTAVLLSCATTEIEVQESRLNKVYKELLAEETQPEKIRLKNAEQLWSKYRDANVQFYFDPEGGPEAHLASVDRFLSMTADRASELESLRER